MFSSPFCLYGFFYITLMIFNSNKDTAMKKAKMLNVTLPIRQNYFNNTTFKYGGHFTSCKTLTLMINQTIFSFPNPKK